MRSRPRGFTLIELMVAVAVVGILSSVALPSFAKYQLRARQAERATITSAIQVAMNDIYLRDGRFPTDLGSGWSMLTLVQNPPGLPSSTKRAWIQSLGSWPTLNLQVEGRVYYTYSGFGFLNLLGPGTRYQQVAAQGDLDGDGIRPTLTTIFYYQNDLVFPGYNPYVYDESRSDPGFYGSF